MNGLETRRLARTLTKGRTSCARSHAGSLPIRGPHRHRRSRRRRFDAVFLAALRHRRCHHYSCRAPPRTGMDGPPARDRRITRGRGAYLLDGRQNRREGARPVCSAAAAQEHSQPHPEKRRHPARRLRSRSAAVSLYLFVLAAGALGQGIDILHHARPVPAAAFCAEAWLAVIYGRGFSCGWTPTSSNIVAASILLAIALTVLSMLRFIRASRPPHRRRASA